MGSIDKACISGFLCRLCSEMHRTVIHIYGDQGQRHGLVEKINGYLPITISPTDPLPKTICETCLRRVEQHYELLLRLAHFRENRTAARELRPRLLRLRTSGSSYSSTQICSSTSTRSTTRRSLYDPYRTSSLATSSTTSSASNENSNDSNNSRSDLNNERNVNSDNLSISNNSNHEESSQPVLRTRATAATIVSSRNSTEMEVSHDENSNSNSSRSSSTSSDEDSEQSIHGENPTSRSLTGLITTVVNGNMNRENNDLSSSSLLRVLNEDRNREHNYHNAGDGEANSFSANPSCSHSSIGTRRDSTSSRNSISSIETVNDVAETENMNFNLESKRNETTSNSAQRCSGNIPQHSNEITERNSSNLESSMPLREENIPSIDNSLDFNHRRL